MEKPLATPLYIIGKATINEVNTATFPEPNHIISNMINQIQTRYRRAQDVKFFDEIIEEWNK